MSLSIGARSLAFSLRGDILEESVVYQDILRINPAIVDLTEAIQLDNNDAIIAHLQRLIPEFKRTTVEMAAANSAS